MAPISTEHTHLNDLPTKDQLFRLVAAGKMVAVTKPKWQLVSSHTARRTAITVGVLRGHNIHALRRCSGHTDLRVFDEYVRDDN